MKTLSDIVLLLLLLLLTVKEKKHWLAEKKPKKKTNMNCMDAFYVWCRIGLDPSSYDGSSIAKVVNPDQFRHFILQFVEQRYIKNKHRCDELYYADGEADECNAGPMERCFELMGFAVLTARHWAKRLWRSQSLWNRNDPLHLAKVHVYRTFQNVHALEGFPISPALGNTPFSPHTYYENYFQDEMIRLKSASLFTRALYKDGGGGDDDHRLLYHTTTIPLAMAIVSGAQGIDVKQHQQPDQLCFLDGFYMSPSFDTALAFASAPDVNEDRAVIGFCIPRKVLDEARGLNVTNDLAKWAEIVYNDNAWTTDEALTKLDYVEGPSCMGFNAAERAWPSDTDTIFCIKSPHLAWTFSNPDHIVGVVLWRYGYNFQ